MAFLGRYVREQGRSLLLGVWFMVIYAVVFALERLPLEAVLYPSLLCTLFGAVVFVIDFTKAKRRHDELVRISGMTAAAIDGLPRGQRIDDEDYQAIIRMLQSEVDALETSSDARYRDMVEYYTLWAHQIKTPIASMRLQLQNTDAAGTRRLLSDLFRIEQYADMVLAFLRLDCASTDYVFKEYSVDASIRQAVKKFSHEFIDRKISLQYEPIGQSIVTDEKWFVFVLEQIISNALKYTREGYVKIYAGGHDTLCIEDTGIGIAPEDLPRIFEKGYTGGNGRSDKRASGIGLYLCKRVCENLAIGIAAQSEIGKGTVIQLNLGQYKLRRE